jgi:PH-interacting protein
MAFVSLNPEFCASLEVNSILMNYQWFCYSQGHQEYIDLYSLREKGPWSLIKGRLSAVEICKVEDLDYAIVPGSGDSCCKITLGFVDPSSVAFGKAFKLTLPELIDFPDFIVEKTRYDASINRDWNTRDRCEVWWRNENGEGGEWWEGDIVSVQAKSVDFPDSPWERYEVIYTSDPTLHKHSPWELHDLGIPWEHPHIDFDITNRLLSLFNKLELSAKKNQVEKFSSENPFYLNF